MPETPSYTEGETLKSKHESFQEDHMGWFPKEGLLFLPGDLQWKLVNSLHVITHFGEKALQRLLERSFRGTGLQTTYKTGGLLLSHLPIKQPTRRSKTPVGPAHPMTWGLPRRGLADGLHPDAISQWYKYLLVMIDTFTGWIEGFPTQIEKVEQVVKKKKIAP